MKKIICILLSVFVLIGCSSKVEIPNKNNDENIDNENQNIQENIQNKTTITEVDQVPIVMSINLSDSYFKIESEAFINCSDEDWQYFYINDIDLIKEGMFSNGSYSGKAGFDPNPEKDINVIKLGENTYRFSFKGVEYEGVYNVLLDDRTWEGKHYHDGELFTGICGDSEYLDEELIND